MHIDVPETHDRLVRHAEKTSLPDLAHEAIVEAIIDGRLEPDARLGIDELCRQLEMSNTPVREALSRAAAERLVIQVANKGYRVSRLLTEEEYHMLFDVRRLLEIHALEQSHADSNDIDNLALLLDAMATSTHGPRYRDFRAFNRMDSSFHSSIVRLSHNVFLIKAWEDLHFHLHVGRLYAGVGVVDYGHALNEHNAIVGALSSGDRSVAVDQLREHIMKAEFRLKYLLNRKEVDGEHGVMGEDEMHLT